MRVNRVKIAFGAIILSGAILALFHEPLLLAVGDFLVVRDELEPADVIHVIAGEDYRTEYAIELYQQGYGKVIFFSGGWCETHQYFHGQHGMQLAMAAGIPQDAIAYDDAPVTSTYEEAVRLQNWIEHHPAPVRSVIVVSDPFHMRRVRWTYRLLFGKQKTILMAPPPFEITPYHRLWWQDAASRDYVKNEYLKIPYYVARYQLGIGPITSWLASFDRE